MLDLEVRRIEANEAAKQRAKADNYGTVKLLPDTDRDGLMDKAQVWADPCRSATASCLRAAA